MMLVLREGRKRLMQNWLRRLSGKAEQVLAPWLVAVRSLFLPERKAVRVQVWDNEQQQRQRQPQSKINGW